MSATDSGPVARREVAYRLFAVEFDAADLEYSDSDEERAPNYVVTPTGARVNRLFAVGVLTEVEPVSDDVLRARVVDPTGAFVVYAGQYQPEAVAFLEAADVPSFVAVTGKARTFQPEGGERVFTSVRPESLTSVDASTRDRWTVQAAEHTLARVATMARALDREERGDELAGVLEASGVEPGLAAGTALAIDHYGTTKAYLAALREAAVAAAAVVAGERDAVPDLSLDPDDDGPADGDLTAAPVVAGTLTADLGERNAAEPIEPEAPPEPVDDASEPADVSTPDPDPDVAEPSPEADPAVDAAAEAEEPATPVAADEPASSDDLGDFEVPDIPEAADADDEPYDLDAAEREAVEAEFGTEFSTGSEVDEPGEAGLETETEPPDTEAPEGATEAPDTDQAPAAEDVADADEGADQPSDEAAVDLEDAAVEAMAGLDDGDGAAHDAVVEAVVAAHGADPEAVEDAIEAALMGGRCYEPSDGRLKAI